MALRPTLLALLLGLASEQSQAWFAGRALPRQAATRPAARLSMSSVPDGADAGGELSRPLSSYTDAVERAFNGTENALTDNPYFDVVMNVAPNEMIRRFMSTSSPQAQASVRTTILGLLGSMPQFAVDTAVMTTGGRLAACMFQLQMTGYMFKNAEYRISLTKSLESIAQLPGAEEDPDMQKALGKDADDDEPEAKLPAVDGMISVTLGDGSKVEVEAKAYMSELRREVEELRSTLVAQEAEKKEAMQNDLIAYIKTLPERDMKDLTANMSPEVLEAMQQLVNVVVQSMSQGEEVGADTLLQQTGSQMGQLCMWQLVIGYNLREMEVKEELRRRFSGALAPGDDADMPTPGAEQTFDFPLEEAQPDPVDNDDEKKA